MNYERVATGYVDAESYPWFAFSPYSDVVTLKALPIEPVDIASFVGRTGAQAGSQAPGATNRKWSLL